ncbi:uncharacterized protein LOC127842292 [Dreissena polymorpha]|uniref:Uncharacterized protein n=1 Tax=Dreissena polymorpha TaxID=45954 RepID=A0A9D4EJS4_DREPO|nr:uncharacterized protein LOC127842292 [Dreissena polymorpha]XP_052227683.1 uncharacterized protein LOC127842292 [Dreissena polymorpha]KAH3781944.1 hypothetical protein DPMN_159853 [Dreissena polymorpha]
MGGPKKFHKGQRKKIKKEVGKTGGGPAPDKLTPLEEKVLTVIPKASIEGVTAEGDVFLDNLKESSIEEKFETEEVQCTHNENKMVSLAENVAPLQLTENLKTQTEVASSSCIKLENKKQKTDTTNTTCQACRSSVTKTQEEMLIASRERNTILKDINKNLEELVSLKKMKFLNAQLFPEL